MFDEPQEDPAEQSTSPTNRAKERADEFRMHAELAAVFDGHRKFDAGILPGLDPEIARETQRGMGRLEKAKRPESPVLPAESMELAKSILEMPETRKLSTNAYHVYRRPGEVMIVRWLAGEQVETFYERIQAHFDAGMNDFREEERQALEWKQDPQTLKYLKALDAVEAKMADWYLRDVIRKTGVFILSSRAADEMNIAHLCDYVMGVPAAEVVGKASAPPDEPTEQDLAWFFKLYSLRGLIDGVERMCFFTYLQKSDEDYLGE
jgi:hypothetical protein